MHVGLCKFASVEVFSKALLTYSLINITTAACFGIPCCHRRLSFVSVCCKQRLEPSTIWRCRPVIDFSAIHWRL